MTQIIKIQGELVTIEETVVQAAVPLADWLNKIERITPVWTPVLPTNTRAMYWDPRAANDKRITMMMEREPQTISMSFRSRVYRIEIPWSRFLFVASNRADINSVDWSLEDYRVFWALNRYTNPSTEDMIPAVVPNIYRDGRICFGSTGANANQPLADRIDQTINNFYASTFNSDLGIVFPSAYDTYVQWEEATTEGKVNFREWDNFKNAGFSWNSAVTAADIDEPRFEMVIVPDPIPPLSLGPSFGRIEEWMSTLTNFERIRLARAVTVSAEENPDLWTHVEEATNA